MMFGITVVPSFKFYKTLHSLYLKCFTKYKYCYKSTPYLLPPVDLVDLGINWKVKEIKILMRYSFVLLWCQVQIKLWLLCFQTYWTYLESI